jgi:capsular exopolysaccharide synthesis family protein
MQYVDEVMDYFDKKESPDVKEFLFRILGHWKIFVLCGIIGVGLGYLVSKYSPHVYMMRSSVLVQVDPEETNAKSLFEGYKIKDKTNIQNHVEILKSFTLNRRAMEHLGWRQSWYKKTFISSKGLYRREPFRVTQHEGTNLTAIPIGIVQVDRFSYKIKVDGKAMFKGDEIEVKFEKDGFFGQPFKNKYFNFTLDKKSDKILKDENFYFLINDMDKLALRYMQNTIISVAEKKAELIHLRMDNSEPARGVDFLNELCWVYLKFGLDEKNKKSENTVRFIDSQLAGVVDSLQVAGQSFTNFRSRNRIVDMGQEAGVVVAKMENLESELSKAQIRLEYYQNLSKNLGDAHQMKQVVAPSIAGITDPTLETLVSRLTDMYGKRETLSYSVQPKNPSLVILNNEIKLIQQSLEENLQTLVSSSRIEVQSLSERMTKVQDQLARMPKNEQKLINMKRNFDLNNELYTFLLKKKAEAAIAKASNVPDSQIIDPARLATIVPIKPKTAINLILGMFLGIGIPFLLIIVREFFNDQIQSREELMKKTQLPILGTIAHNRYSTQLPVFQQPRSSISESFRTLRTNLNYVLPDQPTRFIGVHSTVPNEGKSFTAINLASIIAMNNKKVLLIGADMRKPKIDLLFELENKVGLSTYLIRYNKWQEVVQTTKIKNLYCVTSGPIPPNPAELLENGRLEMFLNAIKGRFDYVIIDNAPISMVTDGIITGKLVDTNLFVLREGFSHREQVNFVNHLAEKGTLENISLVLNDVNTNGFYKGYGSYTNGEGYYHEETTPGIVKRIWDKVSSN